MTALQGLPAWFKERFPPMNFISGFFLFLLPVSLTRLAGETGPAPYTKWIAAAIIPACHLLLLRVFDEHKDFESDRVNNPNRVLQRGIVSLKQIKGVGITAFAVQLACFLFLQPSPALWAGYLALWGWTVLMSKEFFVREWLLKHFLTYALVHMVITPVLLIFCAMMAQTPSDFFPWLAALGFLSSFIYEVARKTKAPVEETGDMSYTKMWGKVGSGAFLATLGTLFTGAGALLFLKAGLLGPVTGVVLVLLWLLHLASVSQFVKAPTPKGRKSNEGTSALMALAIFLVPMIGLWH